MKMISKRAFRQVIAVLLALTMLMGMPGLTVLGTKVSAVGSNNTALRLWYDEPASQTPQNSTDQSDASGTENMTWQQSTLPIGNGDLGASVYGEIGTERLTLNEKTLWAGGPSESRPDYMGGNVVSGKGENGATMRQIQNYFLAGNSSAASNMRQKLTGVDDRAPYESHGYGYFAPWGELQITTSGVSSANSGTYQRWLSLDDALAGVEFTSGSTRYTREYLVSHPDDVLAAKLTATNAMNLTITLPGKQSNASTTVIGNDTLCLSGSLPNNQMKYTSFLKVVPANGTVSGSGSTLTVSGTTEVVLFFSAATDYKNDYPVYRTGESEGELADRVKAVVDAAASKGYNRVKEDHLTDYHSLYNRMSLDLGQAATSKTTDILLSNYNNNTATATERRLLEVMLFQYGRYLTIASSREDSQLPSNLQGVWNNRNSPPWAADYHLNVNLQMNYWPTYVTNLAECADPLIRYVDSLREPGRVTAKVYAGIESTPENPENGFMAHTQNTPFGWTCPGWDFDWGWAPGSVPWILQNCWEYYEYTGDLEYMRKNIYPMMKEEARLYDQLLIDINNDPDIVELATVPAYSPEHGPVTMGNTYEQTLVWQLYTDVITAAELLGDTEYLDTWKYNLAHLKGPIQIGDSGQIKEWYDEVEGETSKSPSGATLGQGNNHRHLSHMLGLFSGDLVQTNEEWIEAARVSMNARVDRTTGWGMGHRINVWARLRDSEHAYDLIKHLLGSGIYNNLWDTHTPFQIDGNFGYTSGVAEMLMQSNMGFIDILPALPSAWAASGSVSGLVARGNFELDFSWADSVLTTLDITARKGGECVVAYPNLAGARLTDDNGNLIAFDVVSDDKISFQTAKGQTYHITQIPTGGVSASEVMALRAGRTEENKVEVAWKAVAGESYQLYRQVADGELLPLGDVTTSGGFTDETAYSVLGQLKYAVGVNGAAPGTPVTVVDVRNMPEMIDNTDSRIKYVGGWANWESNEGNYNNSVEYIDNPSGGETATLTFFGTGIEVMSCLNPDRGYYEIFVDGESMGKVSTYSGTQTRQKIIYSKNDLSAGVHVIQLLVTNEKESASSRTKVELDAFKVLGGGTVTPPASITVSSGGITRLTKTGATLQMTASDPNVTWSVSGTDATISEKGLLTAGNTAGTVTVTATSLADSSIRGTAQITISIPSSAEKEVLATVNGSSTLNTAQITYTGEWQTWNETNAGVHSVYKAETYAQGNSYAHTFTVPEGKTATVEIYSQVWRSGAATPGTVGMYLDNVKKGTASLIGGSDITYVNGSKGNIKVYTFSDIGAGSHTVKGVAESNNSINLDYIKIILTDLLIDRSALVELIQECAALSEENYTPASWSTFQTALNAARTVANAASVTEAEVTNQINALTTAKNDLVGVELSDPTNIRVVMAEGTAITLSWDAVVGAENYDVLVNGQTITTTEPICRVTGLSAGRSYTFTISAKNAGGKTSSAQYTASTRDNEPPTKVTDLTWNAQSKTLTWSPAEDNVGVTGYRVTVDGGAAQTVTGTTVVLSNVDTATQHIAQVTALDAAGNASQTASLILATNYMLTAHNASVDGGRNTFSAGEAVTVTADVQAGHILTGWSATGLDLGATTDNPLSFAMPAGDVTLTAETKEQNWNVDFQLSTNLTASPKPNTVAHGEDLTFTLNAQAPYSRPSSLTVTMGGKELSATKYSYNITTGAVMIPEVTGDVVIKAEAVQTPTSGSFSASNRFVLPSVIGSSSKAEAEYMVATGATKANGPGFNNQHLGSFTSGNKVQLYYTAQVAGTYTATFHYRSGRLPTNAHTLGWSGENVETRSQGDISNTLNATGNASYESRELRFIVPQAGSGRVDFTVGNVNSDFDLDWVSFRLDATTGTQVTGITLEPDTATIYTNTSDPAHTIQLVAQIEPAEAAGATLSWTSSNREVAQVQQNGTVTPVAPGKVTITATSPNGDVHGTAEITVKTKITGSISISGEPRFGNELSVNLNQLEPQGAKGTLSYQWKQGGIDIPNATESTFEVRQSDIAQQITVTVTGNGYYESSITASAVTGAKAAGPKMVAEPTHRNVSVAGATDGAITGLYKGIKYQYQKLEKGTDAPDPDAWVDFSDMTGTETPGEGTGTAVISNRGEGNYVVRRAETATHEAGPISKTVTIVVEGAPTHALTNRHDFEGGTVQSGRTQIPEGDTVNLRVKAEDGYELVEGSLKAIGADQTEYPAVKGSEPDNENGVHYTFEMPAQDVTIAVEFRKLQVRIGHQLEHIRCDLEHSAGEAVHVVDWGTVTEITLTPDEEGYDLPETVKIQDKDGAEFKDYSFRDGKIVFTQPVTQDLTIIATGVWQSYRVEYDIPGLSALDQPREIDRHGKLEVQLTANTNYQLPKKEDITITIAGAAHTDFTYENGKITIAEGIINGVVRIRAEGVSVAPELTTVVISGQSVQGQELMAKVTPEEAGYTARYQWFWVDGETETPIDGATNPRYTLANSDVGKIIKVRVTAVAPYSGSAVSLPVGPVAEAGVVLVTAVELDKDSETILAGGSTMLTATVFPNNATNKTVRWTSGNTSVATVDEHGMVTGQSAGTATIMVTTVNGGKTASCTVNVVNILLDQTSANIRVGGTVSLSAAVSPNLSSQEVTWTSDNEAVATVDETGMVTGISSGTVVITATTVDGEYVASCIVKVGSSGGGSVGGGGSGGSGIQSNTTKQTNPDGSVVTTVKNSDGSVTITVKAADGEELVKVELPAKTSVLENKFVDVPDGHWAEEAIHQVAGLGLVKGVGGNRYDMESPMNRGSLATVLYRLSQGKSDYAVTFRDVAAGRYYTEGVAWAAKAGVVRGITDEIFAPENTITREQLAVMLARYAKLVGLNTQADTETLETFVDGGETGDWAVTGVAWCVKVGILQGKGNNTLDPAAEVTRAEVAVMLDRFIALLK